MRTKDDLLKDLGFSDKYSAHGGIPADTKDVILLEVLIDVRDLILDTRNMLQDLLDPNLKQALIDAGFPVK